MRRVLPVLIGMVLSLALASPALGAKTYNDPWLEGDLLQIRVPQALDILARTPQPVVVGDVDSGVALSDPDLVPRLLRMPAPFLCSDQYGPGPSYAANPANDFGCDFIGSGTEAGPTTVPDGDPSDPFGHGTGVAAIIAAAPNNGIGGAGVAPNARVLPVRACYGGGPDCFNEPALAGLKYAVAMGSTVINGSWPPLNEFEATAGAFIRSQANVLFVFAIGGSDQNNDPYTLCSNKALYPNVVCVGLANPDDSAGTVNAQNSTDVSAPGNAGVPTITGARGGFGYTSGATAHVSGAAAVLRGLAPKLSASTIRQVLVSTSRQLPGYATANKANGIIDLEAAVRSVQTMEGLATPEPGKGAPADIPDPFAGQSSGGGGAPPGGGGKGSPRLAFRGKVPKSVRAGGKLKFGLRVNGAPGTIKATLTHGKTKIAQATKRKASGKVTLKLQVPRRAKLGPAKLSVRIGKAKPLVKTVTVKSPK